MEAIIVAIITGGITLIGVMIANSKSQAVTETKLEELTREVRAHNNFAQRMPVVEEKIKVINQAGRFGGGEMRSVTRILFVSTQLAALCWVTSSYIIAGYATVRLGQPYPMAELSQQAITTILGTAALKVLENIFEHNDGALFGTSHKEE